jgi:hypothetical protein
MVGFRLVNPTQDSCVYADSILIERHLRDYSNDWNEYYGIVAPALEESLEQLRKMGAQDIDAITRQEILTEGTDVMPNDGRKHEIKIELTKDLLVGLPLFVGVGIALIIWTVARLVAFNFALMPTVSPLNLFGFLWWCCVCLYLSGAGAAFIYFRTKEAKAWFNENRRNSV